MFLLDRMKKIIIDTNFLLIPGMFKIDIFSEISRIADFQYKLFIIEDTIEELKKIINSDTKTIHKENAKIGLELVKNKRIARLKGLKRTVDDSIVKRADENTIVATSDKALKHRLKKKGIKLIVLKKKQYLGFE